MLFYFAQSLSVLFIILSLSNFFKEKFKIENNSKYIFTTLLLVLILFITLKILTNLNHKYNLNINYIFCYKIIYISLLIISISILILKKYRFDNLDIFFILLYSIVCLLTYDRYFLDEDELTFWGPKIKEFHFLDEINHLKFNFYHQPFLTSWQLLFTSFAGFKENLVIFANNTLLVCGFFYLSGNLIKSNIKSVIEIILYFSIYYLLINNLSFGFVSIYSDPVIAILFASFLKLSDQVYQNLIIESKNRNLNLFQKLSSISSKFKYNFYIEINKSLLNKLFLFLILISSIYYIHRIGIIFVIISLFLLIVLNYKFIWKYKLSLIFLFFVFQLVYFLFFKQLAFSATPFYLFDKLENILLIFDDYKNNFAKIILTDVYFSSFGLSINKIFEIIFDYKNFFNIYKLNILIWVLTIIFLFFINDKKKFIYLFIFCFFILSFIIFIEKIYFQQLSYLVFGRYTSIFLLSFVLFSFFLKKNYYLLSFFLLANIIITPLKSYGFIVPDKIYYSYDKNIEFFDNRQKIRTFAEINNFCDQKKVLVLYDKNNFPKYLSGHFSLILSAFKFEYLNSKLFFYGLREFEASHKRRLLAIDNIPHHLSFYLMVKENVNKYKLEYIDFTNYFDCVFSINLNDSKIEPFQQFNLKSLKL